MSTTPIRSIALAAMLAGAAMAAHPQGKGEPDLPKPNNPPGVLEGQSAPPPAPPRAPPRPQGAPRAEERFATINNSASSAWITLRQAGSLVAAGCVGKQGSTEWTVDTAGGPVQVTAEITAKEDCSQPVACKAAADRAPGMPGLELQGAGANCQWRPAPQMLRNRMPGGLNMTNNTKANVWATLYRMDVLSFGFRIIKSGCIDVGKGGYFPIDELRASFKIRYEMVRTTVPGNCSAPVDCDTRADLAGSADKAGQMKVTFKSSPQNCWVEVHKR
jgi:hypothetical protein